MHERDDRLSDLPNRMLESRSSFIRSTTPRISSRIQFRGEPFVSLPDLVSFGLRTAGIAPTVWMSIEGLIE